MTDLVRRRLVFASDRGLLLELEGVDSSKIDRGTLSLLLKGFRKVEKRLRFLGDPSSELISPRSDIVEASQESCIGVSPSEGTACTVRASCSLRCLSSERLCALALPVLPIN